MVNCCIFQRGNHLKRLQVSFECFEIFNSLSDVLRVVQATLVVSQLLELPNVGVRILSSLVKAQKYILSSLFITFKKSPSWILGVSLTRSFLRLLSFLLHLWILKSLLRLLVLKALG